MTISIARPTSTSIEKKFSKEISLIMKGGITIHKIKLDMIIGGLILKPNVISIDGYNETEWVTGQWTDGYVLESTINADYRPSNGEYFIPSNKVTNALLNLITEQIQKQLAKPINDEF